MQVNRAFHGIEKSRVIKVHIDIAMAELVGPPKCPKKQESVFLFCFIFPP